MEFEYEGKVYPFEYFIDYVSEPEVMEPKENEVRNA
jgi:hypothetical protein